MRQFFTRGNCCIKVNELHIRYGFFMLTYYACQEYICPELFVDRQSFLSRSINKCVQNSNLIQSKTVKNNSFVCIYLKSTAFCRILVQKR